MVIILSDGNPLIVHEIYMRFGYIIVKSLQPWKWESIFLSVSFFNQFRRSKYLFRNAHTLCILKTSCFTGIDYVIVTAHWFIPACITLHYRG